MEGLYALIILNTIIDTPSRKYPSAMNNTSEFPDTPDDEDVVTGITVPANNKGNPMPAIAIGTTPLCTIARGMIAISRSVNEIINLGNMLPSGTDDIESNTSATDTLTKARRSRLNKLIANMGY